MSPGGGRQVLPVCLKSLRRHYPDQVLGKVPTGIISACREKALKFNDFIFRASTPLKDKGNRLQIKNA